MKTTEQIRTELLNEFPEIKEFSPLAIEALVGFIQIERKKAQLETLKDVIGE